MITWNGELCKEPVPVAWGRGYGSWQLYHRGTDKNDDEASGAISMGQLSAFGYTRVHLPPINLVVYQGPHGDD
jgi:hypothetical protein